MAWVEEVSSVVVGNCEGEEARASPDQILREGEDCNILNNSIITRKMRLRVRKKTAIDPNPLTFLTFTSQIRPKIKIHTSMSTCPAPINACPAIESWLLLPSKAELDESMTNYRFAAIVASWYASLRHTTMGCGKRVRYNMYPVMSRPVTTALNAWWYYFLLWGSA